MSAGLSMVDSRPVGRAARGSGGIEFRVSWGFKGGTKEAVLEFLADCPRPLLHVCCGASRLGIEDVRVDLMHPSADVHADARRLPFKDVGTIFADPPWVITPAARGQIVEGLFKALRPGGRLVLFAPWVPKETPTRTMEDCQVRMKEAGLCFPVAPPILQKWTVGKERDRNVVRWRRAPDEAWAQRRGMKPGALFANQGGSS